MWSEIIIKTHNLFKFYILFLLSFVAYALLYRSYGCDVTLVGGCAHAWEGF